MIRTHVLERILKFFDSPLLNEDKTERGCELTEDRIFLDVKHYTNDRDGEDIDFQFFQVDSHGLFYYGTILHASAEKSCEKIAELVLNKKANVAIEKTFDKFNLKYWTALDISADKYNNHHYSSSLSVFKMIKNRSLELYSCYGLTPFHFDCAIRLEYWEEEAKKRLETADLNATVSAESPFWPAMTPILIAARHENFDLVKRLLDLGADPLVRDLDNNTPLHYLSNQHVLYDDRLFVADAGKNTFGSFLGESHFHVACRQSPRSLKIVKRYLDQGVSPDLQTRNIHYSSHDNAGNVGLHMATCPELVKLLLEYGADFNVENWNGNTPLLQYLECPFNMNWLHYVQCVSLLIEVGSSIENVTMKLLGQIVSGNYKFFRGFHDYHLGSFATLITRLATLNNGNNSEMLKTINCQIMGSFESYGCKDVQYADSCSAELKSLSVLGLQRKLLDDAASNEVTCKSDFAEDEFSWLDTFDFSSYPIYGKLLEIKTKRKLLEIKRKRKLLELKRKRRTIRQAVPHVQRMFESLCHLPRLCAEAILWNFSSEELEQFLLAQPSNQSKLYKKNACKGKYVK